MTSCDTNILFAACDRDNFRHAAARAFMEQHAQAATFVLAEQVLLELYVLLRNPSVSRPPLGPREAVNVVQRFRANPNWRIVDVPGDGTLMTALWERAAAAGFTHRRVFDVRLALTLRHHGVREFATANTRDFADLGFARIWDPLA